MLPNRGAKLSIPRFSIEEYSENPNVVKKLNDAALKFLEELADELRDNEMYMHRKEIELVEMRQQLKKINIMSIFQSVLLIVATTLFGFGVNLATASPHYWPGWVLSCAGSGLQILIIFVGVLARLR